MICCTEPGLTEFLFIHKIYVACKMQKKIKKRLDNGQMLLKLTDKRQARPLVREGAPQRQDSNLQTDLISGRKSHSGLDTKTYWLTEWLTVSRNVTLPFNSIWVVIGRALDRTEKLLNYQWQVETVPEDGVSECTVNQESMWLWQWDSSGIQEGERLPLDADSRGFLRDTRPRRPSACIVNCWQTE
jgi:hypothetical protein